MLVKDPAPEPVEQPESPVHALHQSLNLINRAGNGQNTENTFQHPHGFCNINFQS